jgi:hypothetical protein
MRRTILILSLAVAAAVAANADSAKIDWAAVKPVNETEMKWFVVEQTNDRRAMFGIPESDGALLWFDCAEKKSVTLTYVDSKLEPHADYQVHLKAGGRMIEVAGKTGEKLELDDLVFLTTAAISDASFLANFKKDDPLALVIDRERKGRLDAFVLPPHGRALDPFFKACGL